MFVKIKEAYESLIREIELKESNKYDQNNYNKKDFS